MSSCNSPKHGDRPAIPAPKAQVLAPSCCIFDIHQIKRPDNHGQKLRRDVFPCSHGATGRLAAPHPRWPLWDRQGRRLHPTSPGSIYRLPLSRCKDPNDPHLRPHAARPHRLPRAAGPAPRRRPANPDGRCGCTRSGRSRPVPPASRPRSGRALHAWRPAVGGSAAANGGAAPQSGRELLRAAAPQLSRRRSGPWRPCAAAALRPPPPGIPRGRRKTRAPHAPRAGGPRDDC